MDDPYAADSDHEYVALEADGVDAGDVIDDEVISAPALVEPAPEDAFESAQGTADRERELREMLQDSINRDPEALAADQARRRSRDPQGDLSEEGRRLFENTTEITADDLDMEDLTD